MNVKLVSITAPTVGDGDWKAEDLIAYCARVSNPNNQMNKETAPRLVKYLIKHRHWSPFELASMCVEIKTSRAIAAQILRHRSFSFQEFSQRYSSIQELEPLELRGQAETNRQSSTDVIDPVLTNKHKNVPASLAVSQYLDEGVELYEELIEAGVARETARMVLPLTTETTMYMNGTVRSWIHYIDLRSKEDTQKEHREIAEAIKEVFVENFPNVSEALEW